MHNLWWNYKYIVHKIIFKSHNDWYLNWFRSLPGTLFCQHSVRNTHQVNASWKHNSYMSLLLSSRTLSICGLWLTVAKEWKGTFIAEMRKQVAGVESLSPGGPPPPQTLIQTKRPVQDPRDADRKPALSVRFSHACAKSQIVLWHAVGSGRDEDTHGNVSRQGVHSSFLRHQCISVQFFVWSTRSKRHSHSDKHSHTAHGTHYRPLCLLSL